MTVKRSFAFSRRDFARVMQILVSSPSNQRAQGMPGARCTRGLVCQELRIWRTRAYRAAETLRHPLRNGFTAYFVLSPVSGLVCHRHLAKNFPQGLAPASRRQDHTTSPYAAEHSPLKRCVHRIPRPTCHDDGDTPLWWARDDAGYSSDFQKWQAKFLRGRLD